MITIIIPVFNNLALTKNCVESVYKNTLMNDFKLIIVDNASSDGTSEYLKQLQKEENNFIFIQNKQNLGFAKANNQAAKLADTKKLLFLNNDTEVTANWLKELDKGLEEPDVKIAGAKLLYADNTVQHAGIVFSKFKNEQNLPIIYHIYRNFDFRHPAVNTKRLMQAVTGACLLTYRDFYLEVGGFDEDYINGFEDVDLCLKALEKGGKIIYCPGSTVYHYEGKTQGRHNKTGENTNIFYSRWKDKIIPDDYLYYEQAGFILHNVEQKWKTISTTANFEVREESLEIIFEKKNDKPLKTLIVKDDENVSKNFLLELQKNIIFPFKLIVAGKKEDYFKNIDFITLESFALDLLNEILDKSNTSEFTFITTKMQLNFNHEFKFFDKGYLERKIAEIKNDIFDEVSEVFEALHPLLNHSSEFILKEISYYLADNNPRKALELINENIKRFGKTKPVINLLIETLEKLGDHNTAKKLRGTKT